MYIVCLLKIMQGMWRVNLYKLGYFIVGEVWWIINDILDLANLYQKMKNVINDLPDMIIYYDINIVKQIFIYMHK